MNEASTIQINFVDGRMSVDDLTIKIEPTELADTLPFHCRGDIRVLRWSPKSGAKVHGFVEAQSDSHGFEAFDRFMPFIPIWAKRKKEHDAKVKEREAEKKAFEDKEREQEEAEKKAAADGEKRRADFEKVRGALSELSATDHEVIKAAEAFLAGQGALSGELLARRKAARATAKAEKARLKIK
jgi:hypothetical protein